MGYHVDRISFTYPSGQRTVLKQVSLSVEQGEVVVLLGPNGAGKTTLIHCMMNLLEPSDGTIRIGGKNIQDMTSRELAGKVAYVPQSHQPAFDYSVLDFVLMGRAPKYSVFGRPGREDETQCLDILEELGIEHLANQSYNEISGGEQQQAMIARALAQEPEIILFDEPTAHLDFGNQQRALILIQKMAQRGHGVLMTSHHPDHAFLLGDRTALLYKDGTLVEGPTEEIVTENRLIEMYETPLQLVFIESLGRQACLLPSVRVK